MVFYERELAASIIAQHKRGIVGKKILIQQNKAGLEDFLLKAKIFSSVGGSRISWRSYLQC